MPIENNEEFQKISRFLNFKKHGGAVSALSVFVGTILLLLRLSDEQVLRLKGLWWIISIPSLLVLISWMFTAYLREIKTRIKIEEGIQRSLAILASNFERLFASHSTDKIHLDERFDMIEERLKSIYGVMEKRSCNSGEDTAGF